MTFHNTQLNPDISYGATGGPAFGTTVQTTASGHEYRVSRASRARRRYQFDKLLLSPTEWGALIEFWIARRGHLHGFRFKDWSDWSSAADGVSTPTNLDQVLGTGDGIETQFQLVKTYDDGINPYTESVTLPVAGTIVVAVGGSATTSYTITNPGGLITFAAAPGVGDIVTAGYQFDRPVRFNQGDETLNMRLDLGYLGNWAGITCIETLDEEELPERWYPGGSSGALAVNQDITLTYDVELWTVANSSASTINAFLPPPDRLPGGPRVFRLVSFTTSVGNIQVRDDAGFTVGSALTPGQSKSIALSRSGANALWLVY